STRSPASPPGGSVVSVIYSSSGRFHWGNVYGCQMSLNIQEANVFRVARDEASARLNVLAHQDREQLVGRGGVIEGDLAQDPHRGVHRGFPQLLGVHLTETLVPLDTVFDVDFPPTLLPSPDEPVALAVGVGDLGLATLPLQLVQRRRRQEYVAVFDQRPH